MLPLWIHVACSPSSCLFVKRFLLSMKCFRGSHSIISFPFDWRREHIHFARTLGWGGGAFGGAAASAHRYIYIYISCLSVQQYRLFPDHKCQCPAGQLWSWPPTALQPPQGHIQVKAITSLRLKLLNLPQGPQMLSVSLWPLTCPT